jgi:hypothetical protein
VSIFLSVVPDLATTVLSALNTTGCLGATTAFLVAVFTIVVLVADVFSGVDIFMVVGTNTVSIETTDRSSSFVGKYVSSFIGNNGKGQRSNTANNGS